MSELARYHSCIADHRRFCGLGNNLAAGVVSQNHDVSQSLRFCDQSGTHCTATVADWQPFSLSWKLFFIYHKRQIRLPSTVINYCHSTYIYDLRIAHVDERTRYGSAMTVFVRFPVSSFGVLRELLLLSLLRR